MRRLRHGSTSWPRQSYTMRPEPTPSGQEQRLVYTSSCRRHQRLDAVGEDGPPSTGTPCCPCARSPCWPSPPPARSPRRPLPPPPPLALISNPETGATPGSSRPARRSRPRRPRPGQGQRPRSPPPAPAGHHPDDRHRPPARPRMVTMAAETPGPRPLPPTTMHGSEQPRHEP
jgi:hypothetical protein